MRFSVIRKNVAEVVVTSLLVVLMGSLVTGQELVNVADAEQDTPGMLKYSGGPGTRDLMLQDYSEKTGRTLLLDPKLPAANIALRSQTELAIDEQLEAIERALRMQGIQLIPVGKKFLKVIPVTGNRPTQEGMIINADLDGKPLPETGKLVSQMVSLKHIDIPEAQKVILPFKHIYGTIHALERSNSILITDTAAVVNRMIQILKHIDQPIVAREEPNVVQIRFAKASTVKAKLEDIIRESQAEQKRKATVVSTPKRTGAPGIRKSVIPGVMRATAPVSAPATAAAVALDVEMAERGVIRGKVQITADDRTNVMIIITRPENMTFFNRIIEVLDIETAPDVIVRIFRLEFADSTDVASMLNDLIGQTKGKDDATSVAPKKGDEKDRSSALKDYVSKKEGPAGSAAEAASKVGELSSQNIKILADKRTNALIVMASKSDIQTLELIIKDMDMMLSQVLIEAVILDVGLDDNIQTGVDWVQRAMIAYDDKNGGGKNPLFAFAGAGGAGALTPRNTLSLTATSDIPAAGHGLSYYFTHFGLNLDVILKMSADDARTEVISSPVIVTHDNTEASIESSSEAYVFKGYRAVNVGGGVIDQQADVETRKISLVLTVTPHVNTNGLVVMDIKQKIEELGTPQTIDGESWPIVNSRELKASISVHDKETIVLGGLVRKGSQQVNRGVPFLRKIPLLGALFRSKSDATKRSEVVVFITPYVMDNKDDIRKETLRRKDSLKNAGKLWKKGWSDSALAAPTREQKKEEEKKKRQKKSEILEEELKALREREEARKAEEEEARLKAEEDAREKAHQQRLKEIREEAEAKVQAEMEAKRKAREDARRLEEEKAARVTAEKEAKTKAKAEDDALEKAEKDAKVKAKAEARAEKEARLKAEADAREKARAEEEAREQAEKVAKAKAKADAKAKAITEEKAKEAAEEEARRRAEESDPLHELDPELVDYIKKQEKRMQKKFKRVDKTVEEDMLN